MKRFLAFAILLLGFFLRLHNYAVYPQRGATSDEYTYSFLGLSLLTKGVPISWSHFGAYKNREEVIIDSINFPLVQPYFDHPPLFGLLIGGWSLVNNQYSFEQIRISTIRLVPVALSVVSAILVFLLAYRVSDYMTALWALLIYSTVTIFVIQSRVVLAENLLTPIFLAALLVKPTRVVTLALLSIAAFWTKESGIVLPLSLFFLFRNQKIKKRLITKFLLIASVGILGYALYGWIYSWETFVKIISLQGAREVGPQTFWNLLSTPVIVNKIYYDGWYYFGLFALAYLLSDLRRYARILVPSVFYFLFLLFSLTKEGVSGWYMIPLFPFMAIATAILLRRTTGLFFVFLLFIGFTFMNLVFTKNFGLTSPQFRGLFVIAIVPYTVAFFAHKSSWLRFLQNVYFYVAITLAIFTTYTYVHPA